MKVRKKASSGSQEIELQMTPMIDIVFQLLIFFILTFRVIAEEGDFNIRMPAVAAPQDTLDEPEKTTLNVELRANANGDLVAVVLDKARLSPDANARSKQHTATLHQAIRGKIRDAGGPTAAKMMEVEFTCDYDLKYAYVIDAVTAVSGYKVGEKTVKLIEAIKFSPPKRRSGG